MIRPLSGSALRRSLEPRVPTVYAQDNGPGTPFVFKVLNPPSNVSHTDEFPTRVAALIACGLLPPDEKAA